MFRLLYRLLLQRMGRSATAPDGALATTDGNGPLVVASWPLHRRRLVAVALIASAIVASLAIVGNTVLTWVGSGDTVRTDSASLELQVTGAERWPVVVYLRGEHPSAAGNGVARRNGSIESVNGAFVPTFQVLSQGAAVKIVNRDSVSHNTHVFNRGSTLCIQ